MANTSRIYHYHVRITFKGVGTAHRVGLKYSGYAGAQAYQDTFVFYNKSCHLVLSRSKKYDDGSILSNANNSVNSQIIKALLCYYSITKDYPEIDTLEIVRKKTGVPDFVYTETSSLQQPIVSKLPRNLSFGPATVDGLLEENPRGQALRIAMSYWLKAVASDDVYYKFEHLWRAFNNLYVYHGGMSKEIDNMIKMRNLILSNPGSFARSGAITNLYTEKQLSTFRWSRMLLNDYDTPAKTAALADFIMRYHDGRIMRMLDEKLACRKDYLIAAGLMASVNAHIRSHIACRVDAELVALLSIKYSYFVRNKLFHGEVMDGTFRIKTNNLDVEIQRLNELLEILVMEVIENYTLL